MFYFLNIPEVNASEKLRHFFNDVIVEYHYNSILNQN